MPRFKVIQKQSAGQTVKSRWGGTAFDANGVGYVDAPEEDKVLLANMKWLAPEDEQESVGEASEVSEGQDSPIPKKLAQRRSGKRSRSKK